MVSIRPRLQFFALAAAVVAVECVVLASRAYASHSGPVTLGIVADLCIGLPFAWWLLVVRRGEAGKSSVARVALLTIAGAALALGNSLRLLAIPLELVVMSIAFVSVRRALRARRSTDAATALRVGLRDALGDTFLARALATEFTLFWYALFSWGSKPPEGFTAWKRAGWPAIDFAIAICVIGEGLPFHFLLHGVAAWIAAILHLYTLLWLAGDVQALRLRPIRIEQGVFLLRIGLRWEADIPLEEIESVVDYESVKTQALRLGVLGTPTLTLKLRRPIKLAGVFGVEKIAQVIALQVDDPAGLQLALGR